MDNHMELPEERSILAFAKAFDNLKIQEANSVIFLEGIFRGKLEDLESKFPKSHEDCLKIDIIQDILTRTERHVTWTNGERIKREWAPSSEEESSEPEEDPDTPPEYYQETERGHLDLMQELEQIQNEDSDARKRTNDRMKILWRRKELSEWIDEFVERDMDAESTNQQHIERNDST